MSFKKRTKAGRGTLDHLVAQWRESPGRSESLSPGCRARILDAAIRGSREKTGAGEGRPLFPRWGVLAWAMTLPALLLAVFLSWQLVPQGSAPHPEALPRVSAIRSGGEVVFVIANGGGEHTVYRSEATPDRRLAAEEAIPVTDGTFRDRLDSDAELVFYRIE